MSGMMPDIVVDLLSTDDELSTGQASIHDRASPSNSGLGSYSTLLSGALNNINQDDAWNESVPKRRKLSSSSRRTVGHSTSSALPKSSEFPRPHDASEFSDDIVFTSSACLKDSKLHSTLAKVRTTELEDEIPDHLVSMQAIKPASEVSNKTASFLAKIKQNETTSKNSSTNHKRTAATQCAKITSISPKSTHDGISSADEEQRAAKASKPTARKYKLSEEEKALRVRERLATKEARATLKAKEKNIEKGKRDAERQEKARERQRAADLAEVNKTKKDRKETSKEMIIDLPISFEGERIDDQIKEFLKNQGIAISSYQSPVPDVIRWRRKVDSYFNEELGHRVAMPKAIYDEKHVACHMIAKDFIELATADGHSAEKNTLDSHIRKVKSNFNGCDVMYIIEGLDAWMRKHKNARNRAYQSAVLAQAPDQLPAPSQQESRRKNRSYAPIDEDLVEDALLRLQVLDNCLVYHTATSFESAEWVANFTQHISQLPYRYVSK